MPRSSQLICTGVSPSAAAELAWILDLLVQTARYAEPALEELDRSLLPGVAALRPSVKDRFTGLWGDMVGGCPELLIVAGQAGCLPDQSPRRLLAALSTLPKRSTRQTLVLLSEPARDRRAIRRRLERLGADVQLRRAYRDILREVWELASPAWERRGREVAARASAEWTHRLKAVSTATELVALMPPRHPLTRIDESAAARLLRRCHRFSVAPMYFSMSGGSVAETGDQVQIGVPASALEPVRRVRDAAFVADRMRLLSEPTRVRILIHVLSRPAGVMEVARALRISQPTVSGHVRLLVAAGLVRVRRDGGRAMLVGSRRRFERILEDARGTLLRWS